MKPGLAVAMMLAVAALHPAASSTKALPTTVAAQSRRFAPLPPTPGMRGSRQGHRAGPGMTLQIDLWQAIGLLITIIGAFFGMSKALLAQSQKHIDGQFASIASTLKTQDDTSRRVERELLELKAELPREYVRREDHTRVIASLQLSIENLRLTVERAMQQASNRIQNRGDA